MCDVQEECIAMLKLTWHSGLTTGLAGNMSGRLRIFSKVLSRLLPLQHQRDGPRQLTPESAAATASASLLSGT